MIYSILGDHVETRSHAYLLGSQWFIEMENVIPFKDATVSGTRIKDIYLSKHDQFEPVLRFL